MGATVLLAAFVAAGSAPSARPVEAAASSGCVFSNGAMPAFCDTFDAPAGTGNRSGDLNGAVWGASRLGGAGINYGSNYANDVGVSSLDPCAEGTAAPPHDVQVCNGQLHTSVQDGGGVPTLALYPKQPFDFAGRTGRIVFDVSNDSAGNHAAWPELWMSDQPVPTPFSHEATLLSLPRNGFGIRFAGCTDSSGNASQCAPSSVGVDSAVTVSSYVENDSFNGGSLRVFGDQSVTKSGPGQVNHYEVDVAQNDVEVWATNAYTPGTAVPPLVHVASIPVALTFTRGLVWVEDVHYNANKFGASQGDHTFVWDNVGFDGPVLPQDRTFDVPDNTLATTGGNGLPAVATGWFIGGSSSQALQTLPVDATSLGNASAALVTFGSWSESAPVTYHLNVNGHAIDVPWPYGQDTQSFTQRTLAVPVPLADIVAGPNTVTFSTDNYGLDVFNVDIILVGAGGTPGGTTTTTAPSTTTTTAPSTTTTAPQPVQISGMPCTVTFSGTTQSGTCSGTFTPSA